MGVEKPINRSSELEIDTSNQQQFLPNLDLEQVSPDSEKCPSVEPHSPNGHITHIAHDERGDDAEDKMDDLESPAFEPIQCKIVKNEISAQDDDEMDICSGDSDDDLNKSNGFNVDEVKSNLSSISGLTSNESIGEDQSKPECEAINMEKTDQINSEKPPLLRSTPPKTAIQQFDAIEQPEEKPSIHYTNDVVENLNQDSVLSQVSSNSRLSIITNNNTNTRMDDEDDHGNAREGLIPCVGNGANIEKESTCPYGISEEAQMQRFNDSSSSNNSLVIDTDNVSNGTNQCDKKDEFATAFDINREEIKFEGTERKSFDIDLSELIVLVDGKEALHVNESESNTLEKDVAKTPDTVVASSTDTSKDVYSKSEDVSSVSIVDVTVRVLSTKIENTSDDAKLRTEDSKGLDESSSMSSKHKDCKSSSSTSSSSHRNNIDAHSKPKSKDRHGLSSSSKHRNHNDRSKRSHSSSHSSRDKTKKLHGEVDGKHRESCKHQNDERISKNHRKSSSNTSKTGNDVNRTSSSKNHKDKERSRSGKKDSRHSSSSLPSSTSHDKDITLKLDSKHSDIKASRSESHRSSHREKDDHTSHKIKPMPRRRSRSKDSNEGSGNPSNGLRNVPNFSTSTVQSTSNPAQESGTDQQNSSEQQTMLMDLNAVSATAKAFSSSTSNATIISVDATENDFVLATQPVVVDQILSGNELNLESFIGENRDNPIFSSIERTLADHAKMKKPKIAANIHEARKLMKVRKQIDREEQKKLEKARVLAKKYMRSNLTTVVDDNQGVELEFACMGSSADAPGPSISSPAKLASSTEIVCDDKAMASSLRGKEEVISNINQSESSFHDISLDFDSTEFEGFSTHVSDAANITLRQFEIVLETATTVMLSTQTKSKTKLKRPLNRSTHTASSKLIPSDQFIEMMSSNEDNRQLFLENNKIVESDSPAITKPLNIRKRKYTGTHSAETSTQRSTDESEMASVVANVYITPKAESSSGRQGLCLFEKVIIGQFRLNI